MLQSMTGFGTAQRETPSQTIVVEIKTLNSKYTDIFTRIPRNFSTREIEIRKLLQKELVRGKIDFTLNIIPKDEAGAGTAINRPLVKAYFNDLMQTAEELGFEAGKTEVLRMATMMPNAYDTNIADPEEAELLWKEILEVAKQALSNCKAFRLNEGKETQVKLSEYVKNIDTFLKEIEEKDAMRIEAVRDRLNKAVEDFVSSENFDQNRFEQELIYYIEKLDIAEEKVRLKSHIDYFTKEINKVSNGKKLNFISQEMGREINTIGSKANDAVIQKIVVQMKDELEKIKEQTSNIL